MAPCIFKERIGILLEYPCRPLVTGKMLRGISSLHVPLNFADQVGGVHAEAFGKLKDRTKGGPPHSSFDQGNIGAVHAELHGELFLTQLEGAAMRAQNLAEGAFEPGRGALFEMARLILLAHAAKLADRVAGS